MDWLHRIFFETTEPSASYRRLLHIDVLLCVLLHAVLYTGVFVLICKFFRVPLRLNVLYVFLGLSAFMMVGYAGRLCRVKSLAKVLESSENAKTQLRSAYYTWYFLG